MIKVINSETLAMWWHFVFRCFTWLLLLMKNTKLIIYAVAGP